MYIIISTIGGWLLSCYLSKRDNCEIVTYAINGLILHGVIYNKQILEKRREINFNFVAVEKMCRTQLQAKASEAEELHKFLYLVLFFLNNGWDIIN